MPFFKVLFTDSSSEETRITLSASSLEDLQNGFNEKTSSSASYKVYDDSDGSLILDDECLLGLAEYSTTSKGIHLQVRLRLKDAPQFIPSEPTSPVASRRPPSPSAPHKETSPNFPPLRPFVMDLQEAVKSPPQRRNKILSRTRSKIVKSIVMKCSKVSLRPGAVMVYCKQLYDACPQAFEVQLKEGMPSPMFPQFVRSVYNAFNYSKCLEKDTPRNSKRKHTDIEDDVDDVEPQVPLLCVDNNGCQEGMWGPIILDEERELLETNKKELSQYANVPDPSDNNIKRIFRITYPLQREEINRARSNQHWNSVFASWQILRSLPFFILHADLLLGKDTMALWHQEAANHPSIIDFMEDYCLKESERPSKSSKASHMSSLLATIHQAEEATSSRQPLSIGVFSLIVMYFKETLDTLHILVDKSMSDDDAMQAGAEGSHCPLIIVKGTSIFDESSTFSVLIRGKFLIKTISYIDSVLVLVLSYFVFDILYPKSMSKSLEFFQRFFLRVNPELQTRRENNSKASRISADVRKLSVALTQHEMKKSCWSLEV